MLVTSGCNLGPGRGDPLAAHQHLSVMHTSNVTLCDCDLELVATVFPLYHSSYRRCACRDRQISSKHAPFGWVLAERSFKSCLRWISFLRRLQSTSLRSLLGRQYACSFDDWDQVVVVSHRSRTNPEIHDPYPPRKMLWSELAFVCMCGQLLPLPYSSF